jgi:hypothetical protein
LSFSLLLFAFLKLHRSFPDLPHSFLPLIPHCYPATGLDVLVH